MTRASRDDSRVAPGRWALFRLVASPSVSPEMGATRLSALTHSIDHADGRSMASNTEDHSEKAGLSARMHELLKIATLEERRKSGAKKQSGPDGEERRRTDQAAEEKHADAD
jgi:hypothetical protein